MSTHPGAVSCPAGSRTRGCDAGRAPHAGSRAAPSRGLFKRLRPLLAPTLDAPTAPPHVKWCVYALVLLIPGSFLILPLFWLVRRLGFPSR